MSVVERLTAGSTLTRVQLQTLRLQMGVKSGGITLGQAASQRTGGRKGGPVTICAYYRVLKQARANVRASIMTVLAAMQLGYVKFEDIARLLELVGRGPAELSEEDAERLMGVLKALLDRIVT